MDMYFVLIWAFLALTSASLHAQVNFIHDSKTSYLYDKKVFILSEGCNVQSEYDDFVQQVRSFFITAEHYSPLFKSLLAKMTSSKTSIAQSDGRNQPIFSIKKIFQASYQVNDTRHSAFSIYGGNQPTQGFDVKELINAAVVRKKDKRRFPGMAGIMKFPSSEAIRAYWLDSLWAKGLASTTLASDVLWKLCVGYRAQKGMILLPDRFPNNTFHYARPVEFLETAGVIDGRIPTRFLHNEIAYELGIDGVLWPEWAAYQRANRDIHRLSMPSVNDLVNAPLPERILAYYFPPHYTSLYKGIKVTYPSYSCQLQLQIKRFYRWCDPRIVQPDLNDLIINTALIGGAVIITVTGVLRIHDVIRTMDLLADLPLVFAQSLFVN